MRKGLDKLKKEDEFYQELTISFSGYNIKENLEIAINSFLKLYPFLKSNIIVFDDNSNDGTKEWLEEKGIKRISWTSYKEFAKEVEFISTTLYCNLIVREIIDQTKTKFLMMNDGDVIFYDYFLDKYKNLIQDYYILAPIGGEDLTDNLRNAALQDRINLITDPNQKIYFRIWQGHLMLNLEELKNREIYYDPLLLEYYIDNFQIDSGANFLYEVVQKEIPFFNLLFYNKSKEQCSAFRKANNIFEHIGYVSCAKKYTGVKVWN